MRNGWMLAVSIIPGGTAGQLVSNFRPNMHSTHGLLIRSIGAQIINSRDLHHQLHVYTIDRFIEFFYIKANPSCYAYPFTSVQLLPIFTFKPGHRIQNSPSVSNSQTILILDHIPYRVNYRSLYIWRYTYRLPYKKNKARNSLKLPAGRLNPSQQNHSHTADPSYWL